METVTQLTVLLVLKGAVCAANLLRVCNAVHAQVWRVLNTILARHLVWRYAHLDLMEELGHQAPNVLPVEDLAQHVKIAAFV